MEKTKKSHGFRNFLVVYSTLMILLIVFGFSILPSAVVMFKKITGITIHVNIFMNRSPNAFILFVFSLNINPNIAPIIILIIR